MTALVERAARGASRGARTILRHGELCYLAAATTNGPHVTPVVYAFDGGRLWVTTSRGSVKARAWRADPSVAGMVRSADAAVVFRGTVRTYDAFDPLTWPSAVAAAPRLVTAAMRFTLKNARFFFGYAIDAPNLPLAWAPPGRVFVSVEMVAGRLLDLASGEVVEGWGRWSTGASYRASYARAPAGDPSRSIPAIPEPIRRALGQAGEGALALQAGATSLTVLPAAWTRADGRFEATLPRAALELSGVRGGALGALVMDRASAWRASEMRGALVQGRVALFAPPETKRGRILLAQRLGDGEALVRLDPRRAVWWEGWSSGTVTAASTRRPGSSANRRGREDRARKGT